MYGTFKNYLKEKAGIEEKEFEKIKPFFKFKLLRKRQFLLQKGEVSIYTAFVEKGCLRSYTIDEKGDEHVLQFALENWWIGDQHSFITGEPSSYYIDAIEDSEILLIDKSSSEKLNNEFPKIENFSNLLTQKNRAALERRISVFLSMSAEQKYLYMLDTYPDIVQRVPLLHIASYLGISPESLSRIRHNLSKKQ